MESSKWNKDKLTVADVRDHVCKELESKYGVEVPAAKRQALLIEALLRNVVLDELKDIMLFIADEDKWSAEMDKRHEAKGRR